MTGSGSTLLEHLTTDPEIKGLNLSETMHQQK
jgi:hypothetical protein